MPRTETFEQSAQVLSSVARVARSGIYIVLRLLRPLVSLGLVSLAFVCVFLLVGSMTFPPGTHFPTGLAAGTAIGCLALNYAYGMLMDLVDPDR